MACSFAEIELHVYLLQAPVPLKRLHSLSFTSGSFDAGPLQGCGRHTFWKCRWQTSTVCMQDTVKVVLPPRL